MVVVVVKTYKKLNKKKKQKQKKIKIKWGSFWIKTKLTTKTKHKRIKKTLLDNRGSSS